MELKELLKPSGLKIGLSFSLFVPLISLLLLLSYFLLPDVSTFLIYFISGIISYFLSSFIDYFVKTKLVKIVIASFYGIISIVILINFFSPFFMFAWTTLNMCKEVTKTFEYAGCSVNYIEIIEDGCYPCGGMTPCISGVDHRDILTCLCGANKFEDAKNFFNEYLDYEKDMYNISDPSGQDICNNRPAELRYA